MRRRAPGALAGAVMASLLAGGLLIGAQPGPVMGGAQPDAVISGPLPWMSQADGSPRIDEASVDASVVFAPGFSYPQALRVIYRAAHRGGALPDGVSLAPALPAEVVVLHDREGGLRVSLLAPFGWTPEGRLIRPASLRLPAGASPEDIQRLLGALRENPGELTEGVALDVPDLIACQVAHGDPEGRPACP